MADEIYAVLIADVMASSARKNVRGQLAKKLADPGERDPAHDEAERD